MSTDAQAPPPPARLDVTGLLAGARLIVMGGTGFLGKVWLSFLLHRFPEIEHVWLVVRARRDRDGSVRQSSEERFWAEVATSPAFDPLRQQWPGAAFEMYIRSKITPIDGDVSKAYAGVASEIRDELRGNLTALVNSSGVVDFNPPLDEALNVNAFGMQNLVALARDLGDRPFLHTSTCYVAGDRTGQVDEVDPRHFPFPRAAELDPVHWDPAREIAECVDLVDNVRLRSGDAFRQSAFLAEARKNLTDRREPTRGAALTDELEKVRRRYEADQLIEAGNERAKFWGWHNIYTYTKSIGEQILATSGLPFTIVRPAVIESSMAYPVVGWNEGINTTAPVIYLAMKGPGVFPAEKDSVLDVIPVDHVAAGMCLSLAELLEGTAPAVYQYGSSDTNPLRTERIIELVGLYKRKHYINTGKGSPFLNYVQSRMEPVPAPAKGYLERGPSFFAETALKASGLLRKAAAGPLSTVLGPAADGMASFSKQFTMAARIIDNFVPFMATHNYRFSCAHTRAAYARLSDDDKALLPWTPEQIDWRVYFHDIHCPGLDKFVMPLIDERLARPVKPLKPYDNLLDLIDEIAEQHALAPALMRTHTDGFTRVSYLDLRDRAAATAARLTAAGVDPGDRVLLSGLNHPDWVVAWFGVLRAGAVVVPVDPALPAGDARVVADAADLRVAIVDARARDGFGAALDVPTLDLHAVTAPAREGDGHAPPRPHPGPTDVASILFTSGTTGVPKGVMLTHGNFASMLASLARLFPLETTDRVLSVLPLHHTFEFSCGLLLPLSRGARIIYLDEVSAERLSYGLREGRVTAMVGVPALWQLLERRIRSQVRERGKLFESAIDVGMDLNRMLGKATGLDAGRLFFGPVHDRLGGNIRTLISGGAALPADTQRFFSGLGLQLSEGYGLTEAAPVLTVSRPKPGSRAGTVGKPIPGVEVRVLNPDDKGVGEVVARGPNVMTGYFRNEDATSAAIDDEGWLHTGDLGRLDHKGQLVIVGRAKEVVVTAAGENIYLDDVEARMGRVAHVEEYTLVGLSDPRGGERLALLAVPKVAGDQDARTRARDALRAAIDTLPGYQRPSIVHLVDAPLPRTATRKVQRKECSKVLERIVAASEAGQGRGEGVAAPVARAIAGVAGVEASKLNTNTKLASDLGYDSLMWVELSSALEAATGQSPGVDALSRCETVADVVALVAAPPPEDAAAEASPAERAEIPAPLVAPLKSVLGFVQRELYHSLLDARFYGRAYIPHNRPVIVISNHSSHLDMGLVKMALGPYGQQIVGLAAKDYFFEGNRWAVAYFEQLTNLKPLDRKAGFRASFQQAREVVEAGNIVLLFPEGTRSPDGSLQPFKPLVGKLALETGTDLLPMYLEGAHSVLPKGASVPRGRRIAAHIGPPLAIGDLQRLTRGLRPAEAARRVSQLGERAVAALRDGDVLDLSRITREALDAEASAEVAAPKLRGIEAVMEQLRGKYDPARVEQPVSWYFSLGGSDGPRWTVRIDATTCEIHPGRPTTGAADCVVKCSEELLTRMVREGYVPEAAEFFSGAIKTNEIPLLIEFGRVFGLAGGEA